ncbi:MAG: hypothetical protein NC308_04510 [Clostridium sp.]|nr:hypothetical protein [Bacteroides sp.]MCM1198129.1 hypothetical protein [Clostridium sp.]
MLTGDSHIGRSMWSSELKLPHAYHAGLLVAAISVNVLIWLLLNYRVSALVEDIGLIYFWLDLVQIAVETIFLVEVSLLYFRWAFRKFLGERRNLTGLPCRLIRILYSIALAHCQN